jgi:DNA-binding PadR family transcriptional regulator
MKQEKALKRLKLKITKETLWIYIARLLQERPMYGYEIREHIRERFDFEPARVTAYVVLYSLQREGIVESKMEKSPLGKPSRKYYTLTEKGAILMRDAKKFVADLSSKLFDLTKD